MPTEIYTEQITGGMAWTGGDFTKEDLSYWLSSANVAALHELSDKLRGVERDDITGEDTHHHDLDDDLRGVYEEIVHGRGLVVVRGFPVDGPVEEIERLYWIYLSHFGPLVSANSFGDRMVRVQQEILPDGVQSARGTKSANELAMHNDLGDIFNLLCVHQAKSGGESQFSSGTAAHNTILAQRPDLLPILYRGFPHHRRTEQADGEPDVTPYDMPIFANVNGRISIDFVYSSIAPALHVLGRTISAEEEEAMDLLRQTLIRQQIEIRYDRGDMVMANNFGMCHARSDYVDGDNPETRRLLLRAWNEVPPEDRRKPPGREYYLMQNKSGRDGIDPVPGHDRRIDRNDYENMPQELADLFRATQKKPALR